MRFATDDPPGHRGRPIVGVATGGPSTTPILKSCRSGRMPDGYQRIETVLREHFGEAYQAEQETPTNGAAPHDEDAPHSQLSAFAMENLSLWVPKLGIPFRRIGRRYASYEVLPMWRPA